jgi:hypothetical protein
MHPDVVAQAVPSSWLHGMGVPEQVPPSLSAGLVLTAFGPSFLPLTPGQLPHPATSASNATTPAALSSGAIRKVKRRNGTPATGATSNID